MYIIFLFSYLNYSTDPSTDPSVSPVFSPVIPAKDEP